MWIRWIRIRNTGWRADSVIENVLDSPFLMMQASKLVMKGLQVLASFCVFRSVGDDQTGVDEPLEL